MTELSQYSKPQMPRFNAWRFVAMLSIMVFVLLLPFVGWFFYQLTGSQVNLAENYFLGGSDNGKERVALMAQVRALKEDTARMGRKIRVLEMNAPTEISISNSHNASKLPAIKPFGRQQSEFANYGQWATEGMRYYRNSLNQLYKACGAKYQVK